MVCAAPRRLSLLLRVNHPVHVDRHVTSLFAMKKKHLPGDRCDQPGYFIQPYSEINCPTPN